MIAPLEVDCVGWLQNRLSEQMAGVKVSTELPSNLADSLPRVQLVPVGGGDDGIVVDEPRIIAHCFDATPSTARALALRLGTACRALVGTVAEGATMQSVTVTGMTVNNYPNTSVREIVRTIQPRIKTAGV